MTVVALVSCFDPFCYIQVKSGVYTFLTLKASTSPHEKGGITRLPKYHLVNNYLPNLVFLLC